LKLLGGEAAILPDLAYCGLAAALGGIKLWLNVGALPLTIGKCRAQQSGSLGETITES